MSRTSLIFVYNADTGLFNTLADAAHKVLSPRTYQCSLCAVTHGHLGMRPEWKRFVESLEQPVRFLHRDEFHIEFEGMKVELPAVLIRRGDGAPEVLVPAERIRETASVDELVQLVRERLNGATR